MTRIAVAGDSAGGHLAAATALDADGIVPAGALKAQALAGRADRDALTLEVEEMELEHVQHLLRRERRDTSGDEETVRGRLIELLLEEPQE